MWWLLATAIILIVCVALIAVIVYNQNVSEGKTAADDKSGADVEREGTVEIIEKNDASYERWLAASMVTAVSMQYTEFEIDGIYLTGETDLSEKMESAGAYIVFTADGTETAIHSVPLDAERTDAGTTDLYTRDLGFATFDTIDPSQIDTGSCEQIEMDELTDLISQSLLVSLYEH